jgi:hypothetical protein
MPATVSLVHNNRILHYVFEDPVNFKDINAVEDQAKPWYDRADRKLHIFIDIRLLRHLPDGFFRVRSNHELTHRNAGNIAVLGSSVYLQAMAETIFRLTRNKRFQFFDPSRVDAAWKYLDEVIASENAQVQPVVPLIPAQH